MATLWNGWRGWIAPRANPIGVDFGTSRLRLAQTETVDGADRLIAAAAADVPAEAQTDPAAREAFFVGSTRRLLASAGFRGRAAVLALPAAQTYFQHLRLAKMDEAELRAALPFEAAARLPITADRAVIRHLIAGDISGAEARQEVILMAADRGGVDQFLSSASRAKLDVVGMEPEALALVNGFGRIYRRKIDAEQTLCFIDLGTAQTRVTIARAGHILFARSIGVGTTHLMLPIVPHGAAPHERELIRPLRDGDRPEPIKPPPSDEAAFAPAVGRLADEIGLCRHYHEAAFPDRPIQRLIFVGGGAHATDACRALARRLGMAASVGDPLLRMAAQFDPPEDCPLAVGRPAPDWFAAVSLSLTRAAEIAPAKEAA